MDNTTIPSLKSLCALVALREGIEWNSPSKLPPVLRVFVENHAFCGKFDWNPEFSSSHCLLEGNRLSLKDSAPNSPVWGVAGKGYPWKQPGLFRVRDATDETGHVTIAGIMLSTLLHPLVKRDMEDMNMQGCNQHLTFCQVNDGEIGYGKPYRYFQRGKLYEHGENLEIATIPVANKLFQVEWPLRYLPKDADPEKALAITVRGGGVPIRNAIMVNVAADAVIFPICALFDSGQQWELLGKETNFFPKWVLKGDGLGGEKYWKREGGERSRQDGLRSGISGDGGNGPLIIRFPDR